MTNWGYVGAKAPLLSTTPPYAIVTCDSGGMQRHPMFIRTHFLLSWPKGPVACRDQRGLLHLSRKCQRLPAETMKSLVSTVRLKGPVARRDQHGHLHLSRRCRRHPVETAKKSRFYRQTQGSGSMWRYLVVNDTFVSQRRTSSMITGWWWSSEVQLKRN